MSRDIGRFVIVLTLASVVVPSTAAAADDPPDRSVEDLAQRLCRWLADPDPTAAARLRAPVALGVPPGALLVLLDAYRAAPRPELSPMVQELAGYRRTDVRARALAAWAALDGAHADAAIAAAADDVERSIRKLAVALAQRFGTARADEIVAELLARDEPLRAEIEAAAAPIVPQEPS